MFVSKIKQLASLAGFTNNEQNTIERLIFVNGFPDNINANLQQTSDIMSVSDIVSRDRILNSKISESEVATDS